ncbi:MAG: tRNA 2-thiouridine(34) synthase MnmA [Candidatus Adiutrix sp.]|nr:tRNA 2-thiouridine(34) synthase MnmA [Candidatus Adiutrix sp.]
MPKVLAAMSGGVDSSVAALLLRDQGFEVVGATLKMFDNRDLGLENDGEGRRTCCALADIDDAREVAGRLGLEHRVFNFRRLFHHEVIRRFAEGYLAGQTPNPCLDCNRYIKFHHLWERAEPLGCHYLATGHYARVDYDRERGRYLLKKAEDQDKDQTYVLYCLTQAQLARTLFPLGGLDKKRARQLAEGAGLVNARKPDSQDICFVQDGDYAGFLTKVLGLASPPGDFVDQSGRKLGRHRGLIHYTIGQRRGLRLCFGQPRYVVSKDAGTNTITLGLEEDLSAGETLVDDVNLISVAALDRPLEVTVKIRCGRAEWPARVEPVDGRRLRVVFHRRPKAVAPGQAAVFYQGEVVLGGGTIIQEERPI